MKRIFTFIILISALNSFSQNLNRLEVKGKIIVESNDVAGITVFNKSSNIGTITNEIGEFTLKVTLNDIIEVSALQYQSLSFSVNEDIIESRSMKVFLIEEINKLDEIILLPNNLTGNLDNDMSKTKRFTPKMDAIYFGIKNSDEFDVQDNYKTEVKNMTVNTQKNELVNGLNIVNVVDQLLLPLFRSEVKNKKKTGVPDVPVESIKYYFGSEFLVDNFKIPEHRVEEFIRYVESDDFDFSLLNYGKEMEFLELLNKKSVDFLNK
ncbi:carboxypeptidase-like regulatory domain-containing protein [Algibacter aquimarinus]|uniref:CarboxypepD_reg-like domain-containing protein n=1 Tax=Algibacter aquimarinus TaxID=1136748 RepID=A0ABP9H7Y0_9FLAO